MIRKEKETFVTVSCIAADLSAVKAISSELHMSTLNAKVVTARSGTLGRTFQPLTDYAASLSRTTSGIVEDVSNVAIKLTKISVDLMHSQLKAKAFQNAARIHGQDHIHYAEIIKLAKEATSDAEKIKIEYLKSIKRMLSHISYLSMDVQSIAYLGMNCRIEASTCNEYKEDFDSIAFDIEAAASRVKDIVARCERSIENDLNIRC